MDYIRRWFRNFLTDLLILVAIVIGMLLFMRIFYPDALSFLFLTGSATVQLISALKFWPLVILMVIVYSLPRPRRRR
jgi:hypothetical protein